MCQERTSPALFDQLVGEREKLLWNLEAERFGLEVDRKLEFGRLHDRFATER